MRSRCSGPKCGREIVWGVDADGQRMPLDPRPPVYDVDESTEPARATRRPGAMVSRFATCKDASRFSGSKR
jgi:hypothetical protein